MSVPIRIHGQEPALIPDFPKTMNGCAQSLHLVRWRSLGGPLLAGMTSKVQEVDGPITPADLQPQQKGEAGLLEGSQCDEPIFLLPRESEPDSIVDVVVEYQIWKATP